jgi:hypothetical protein
MTKESSWRSTYVPRALQVVICISISCHLRPVTTFYCQLCFLDLRILSNLRSLMCSSHRRPTLHQALCTWDPSPSRLSSMSWDKQDWGRLAPVSSCEFVYADDPWSNGVKSRLASIRWSVRQASSILPYSMSNIVTKSEFLPLRWDHPIQDGHVIAYGR